MAPHAQVDEDSIDQLSYSRSRVTEEIPVLIIGGGPSGLLQAHLLSCLGVRSIIIERYHTRLAAPKAHALSPRSLEICRQFGFDLNAIRRMGSSRSDAYWVNFVTSLGGETVGRLPYERMDATVLEATPAMIHNIAQPQFEQLIADRLTKDTRTSDGVTTIIEDRNTKLEYKIRSQYVIACDGAKSKVREHLKIDCEGEDSSETMMTIHFSADLRPVVGDRVGMLHWVMDPEVAGFVIAYDLSGNQVLICNFDLKKNPIETWNESYCRKIVSRAIGKDIPFKLWSHRPWILRRKVANDYRRGRIFLAGDAAHSFPPTGGLGLNSGLADVHNLAYKIAATIQGWGGEGLLDTYHDERRHVALVNSQQSIKNGEKIFSLLKSLGTTALTVQEARENLYRTLKDPQAMKEVHAQIEEQREHFDNLNLHIGYVYGAASFPSHASRYVPTYTAGARLPHAWITPKAYTSAFDGLHPIDNSYVSSSMTETEISDRKWSSLDLCAFDAFTIIIGSAEHWGERLGGVQGALERRGVKSVVRCMDVDFTVLRNRTGNEWVRVLGLEHGGAVVIRPDQHILGMLASMESSEGLLRLILGHLGL